MLSTSWGKADIVNGEFHHLIHHCADVAASLNVLLSETAWRTAAAKALGRPLGVGEVECLTALAFLHDIGKLAPAFQAKAWPCGHGVVTKGHLECGWIWLRTVSESTFSGTLAQIASWPKFEEWLKVIFAHHGRPSSEPPNGAPYGAFFPKIEGYDWRRAEAQFGAALRSWFPQINTCQPPAADPEFAHFLAGLLNLADWIGSDRRAFPFEAEYDPDYWPRALSRAKKRLSDIGAMPCTNLRAAPDWELISHHPEPRPAQRAVGTVSTSEQLLLLEAETGAGKTEAALWRFARLLSTREVDALYFAVPTKAAARQLQRRINASLTRMFDDPPEALLAIPGQVQAGEAKGRRLPDFSTLWSDEKENPGRWAAEHSARFLAARIAIGTVDQVALGGLQVRYAHLRGAALARSLLVIDEVHASDPYMTEVQLGIAKSHLRLGGHLMLMSATLGAAARRRWRDEEAESFSEDAALPYPALWTSKGVTPIETETDRSRHVRISSTRGWSGEAAAALALEAAGQGARVLVIRNTVQRAQETFLAFRDANAASLLAVNGVPTLHHSRFAAEDRSRLDQAVEQAIGKDSPIGGRIVIGTQTLEQSLDLCADLLITDLCPMDVLLQRIGRLHRHLRLRPEGFEAARAVVLAPDNDLGALTQAAENGLGAYANGPSLSGVYVNVPSLAATLQEIERKPLWRIPEMNRELVEAATHPDALQVIAETRGWESYHQRVQGKALAEARLANLLQLNRAEPLCDFPSDEAMRTRLGEEGILLTLPPGTVGPFGTKIYKLALPAHWCRGLCGDEAIGISETAPLTMTVSDMVMTYGPEGLRLKDD